MCIAVDRACSQGKRQVSELPGQIRPESTQELGIQCRDATRLGEPRR
jgi:hypothetical protein